MQFTLPATKEEMYETLQEIFHYYRMNWERYAGVTLTPLSIPRLTFTAKTNLQLESEAETIIKAEHEREIQKLKESISSEIASLDAKISVINTNASEKVNQINTLYASSEAKVLAEANKKGLGNSSIALSKIAELESEKNTKILAVNTEKTSSLSDISAKKTALNTKLTNADTYYSTIHGYEKTAKVKELKEADDKLGIEIQKYNNSLYEKETRYSNTMLETNATLQLRFMEISSNYFTKDQLLEMGYYDDVMLCVNAYYGSMAPSTAFADMKHESKLAFYLDDYYENILYQYKVLATS